MNQYMSIKIPTNQLDRWLIQASRALLKYLKVKKNIYKNELQILQTCITLALLQFLHRVRLIWQIFVSTCVLLHLKLSSWNAVKWGGRGVVQFECRAHNPLCEFLEGHIFTLQATIRFCLSLCCAAIPGSASIFLQAVSLWGRSEAGQILSLRSAHSSRSGNERSSSCATCDMGVCEL